MFNRQSTTQPRDGELNRNGNGHSHGTSIPPLPTSRTVPIDRSEAGKLSIIGNDLTIMGERIVIITKGILQVDGEVQADLHGAEVIIGEAGKVTGTICADAVSVRGQVFGTVKGIKVELMSKSTVEGDIYHQTLVVIEGASFDGRVRRPKDVAELRPMLDPKQHAGSQAVMA